MPRRKASNLYRMMVSEGQSRGASIHNDSSGRPLAARIGLRGLNNFRNISEELGVDQRGHPLRESWGAELDPRAREGRYDPEQQYGFPVKHKRSSELALEDYSIRDLAAQLIVTRETGEPVGDRWVRDFCDPGSMNSETFLESGTIQAVDYSLFYGITGQLIINRVLQSYIQEEYVITNLCGRYPTNMMDGERVPGVGLLEDPDKSGIESITRVKPQQPIKFVGLSEEYIELPQTKEHAIGIAVDKKTIYGDRTGLVLQRAGQVGTILGLRKEKELIGVLIGAPKEAVLYREKRRFDSAPVNADLYQAAAGATTYQLATSNAGRVGNWVNDIPSNPMVDFTAFRTADRYFAKTVDPNTGEPIVIGRPFVVLPYTKRWDLLQIVQALNLYKLQATGVGSAPGTAFGVGHTLTQTPMSALSGLMAQQFATSRQLRAQMITHLGLSDSDVDWVWFNGDFGEAIKYSENWPITVVQAAPDSWISFSQNIPVAFAAREMGAPGIHEPRCVQRHNYLSETSGT